MHSNTRNLLPLPMVSIDLSPNDDGTDIADRESDTVIVIRSPAGAVLGLIFGNRTGSILEISVSQLNEDIRRKGYYRAALRALTRDYTVLSDTQRSAQVDRAYRMLGATERRDDRLQLSRLTISEGATADDALCQALNLDARVQASTRDIKLGNNGYADIGNDAVLASRVECAGFVVIRTRNLHGHAVFRGFTRAAQAALQHEPFGVSTYRCASPDAGFIEEPDYEAAILSRQADWIF
ncbi:hypothetical protein [Burkholderia cepacia]|uniref:hypothetical protein n=1 Tax=Burkholderia cepacia TaxID=292 RepID=UPI002AB76C39|nr:hypothetical protein [Burkholderia cepacia]